MRSETRLRPALRPPALRPWIVGCAAVWAMQLLLACALLGGRIPSTHATEIRPWNAARLDALLDQIAAVPPQQRDWLRAMVAIRSQMGQQAVRPLVAATQRDSESARRFALEALGMLGDPQTVPVVLAALQDPDPLVVASAVTALGDLGGPAARDALLEALHYPNDVVRMRAVQSVAFVEWRGGDVDAVIACADDESGKVRDAAHVTLTSHFGLSLREPQRSSAEWRDWLRDHNVAGKS